MFSWCHLSFASWRLIIYLRTAHMSLQSSGTDIRVYSLGGRVRDELDALADVALQAVVAGLEKLLLCIVGAANDINGLLGTSGLSRELAILRTQAGIKDFVSTYTKLNGDGEEVKTSGLGDGISTLNTREVDVAGLDNTLLALGGLDDLLGEAVRR
jgi:hypothetical protein